MAFATDNPRSSEQGLFCDTQYTSQANVGRNKRYLVPRNILVSCELDRLKTALLNDFVGTESWFVRGAGLFIITGLAVK
jgi:hypothetical protein